MFHVPDKYRVLKPHPMGSTSSIGNNGAFQVVMREPMRVFWIIASNQYGWEHVSVSVFDGLLAKKQTRCPTWEEMCKIKDLFWDKTDCVIEYHPAETEYVNVHKYCLHLWRPTNQIIPIPPKEMVG